MSDTSSLKTYEETLLAIKQLQTENKQLNRKISILQKKINTAEMAERNDKLLDTLRSAEQKKLEKYMRLLLEYSNIIILMLDDHGRFAYCSSEFLHLTGITDFNFINGRTLEDIFSVFESVKLTKNIMLRFEDVKNKLLPVTFNTKIFFPSNKTERLYTLQLAPITDGGVFDGEIIICHDTTELRDAEADERTRLMLDSTPLACSLWTAKGRLIGFNKTTIELLGLNSNVELSADSFFACCPDIQEDGISSVEKWNSFLQTAIKNGSVKTEWMCLINEEEILPMYITFVSLPWKNTFRIAAYATDLRELRLQEMAVRKANEENYILRVEAKAAEAASNAKSDFLATISHELRTPLNVIIGMSELMPVGSLNETQKNYISEIQIMSKSLLNLISDILDFSKIEAGKFDILPVCYSLKRLINNIDSMFKHTAGKKGLAFTCHISGDIPDVLYGDEIRVRQVITNIAGNAVKYTPTGSIDIFVNKAVMNKKTYLEIKIKDTGIGIKNEDKLKMFTAFQQFDTRKNRGIMGTGLGLAISKKLTDMMGGIIDMESEYGKGSIFRILLPLVEGDPAKLAVSEKNYNFIKVKEGAFVKALVVDDMPENITVAKGFLAMHGINADTALSGAEGVSKTANTRYDIIFMDQMMPGMDGLEAARHIRALAEKTGDTWFSEVPVIALSANVASGAIEKFAAAGMNDFVSKPIDAKNLNKKLTRWLPPEKIEYNHVAQQNDSDEMEAVFEQLKTLKGIDLADGFSHTGGGAAYLKVFRQFCAGFDDSMNSLRDFLEKSDIKSYHIKIHALKGIFATLGFKDLSGWAKKLEDASAETKNEPSIYLNEMKPFIDECRAVFGSVLQTLKTENAAGKKNKGDIDSLAQNLKELETAVETGHANLINDLIEKLSGDSFDEKIDSFILELKQLTSSFDYDVVLQKIKGFNYGSKT
ncbi:MAG: response regulator [Treponema sp.]|jgi:PAS domain S-box-containing protein|nr:response regulator [Treponema sp.]